MELWGSLKPVQSASGRTMAVRPMGWCSWSFWETCSCLPHLQVEHNSQISSLLPSSPRHLSHTLFKQLCKIWSLPWNLTQLNSRTLQSPPCGLWLWQFPAWDHSLSPHNRHILLLHDPLPQSEQTGISGRTWAEPAILLLTRDLNIHHVFSFPQILFLHRHIAGLRK